MEISDTANVTRLLIDAENKLARIQGMIDAGIEHITDLASLARREAMEGDPAVAAAHATSLEVYADSLRERVQDA